MVMGEFLCLLIILKDLMEDLLDRRLTEVVQACVDRRLKDVELVLVLPSAQTELFSTPIR